MHASAVAAHGQAILILGATGAGKSALSLQLMALGAGLIADDQCVIGPPEGGAGAPRISAPPNLPHLIEARGLGLLRAQLAPPAPLALIVDLNHTETHRLPPRRHARVMGIEIALVHNVAHSHFPAALLQYIKGGRDA